MMQRRPGGVLTADGLFDPSGVRGVGHHVEHLVGQPPDDDVVDHRPVGIVEEVGVLGPARARSGAGRWTVRPAGDRRRRRPRPSPCPDGSHRRSPHRGGRRGARPACPHRRRAASPSRRTRPACAPSRRWASISAVCRSGSALGRSATDRRAPSGCRPRPRGYRRTCSGGAGDTRLREPLSPARPYLASRARVSRWYKRVTLTSG